MDTVLIVDDEKRILQMMHRIQEKCRDDFELITASSGEAAMKVLAERPVDLVITDLVMPRIDGLTLLTYINEHYPRILCIAMTGYATDSVIKMLPDNLLQLIRKPFKLYELVAIIKESLKIKPPSGSMGGISIASFLQLVEMDQKSCAVEVTLADHKTGTFLFKEGVLYDAIFGELTGEGAALELLMNEEKAKFTLNPLPKQDLSRRINSRIMELLLKASQRRDDKGV